MKNIELNLGGLIGALLGGGIAAAVIFSQVDASTAGRGDFKALIAGAFAGNFLWDKIFKKDQTDE